MERPGGPSTRSRSTERSAAPHRSARLRTSPGGHRYTPPSRPAAIELCLGTIGRCLALDLVRSPELQIPTLQGLQPPVLGAGQVGALPRVLLGPADPMAQGLCRTADLARDRGDRRPLRVGTPSGAPGPAGPPARAPLGDTVSSMESPAISGRFTTMLEALSLSSMRRCQMCLALVAPQLMPRLGKTPEFS